MTALETVAGDVAVGARLLWGLPGFLRHSIRPEEARAILRRRLERRETDFLTLARRAIYAQAASPYRQLLTLAGCAYGDLERLVGQEGLEGALRALFQQGVYLTVDELKGRRPAVRGSATVAVDPTRVRNPRASFGLPAATSGSRGPRMAVPLDLAFLRDGGVNIQLFFDARGRGWTHALWGMPGGSVVALLKLHAADASPDRWFLQIDPTAPGLPPRYHWSAHAVRLSSVLAGVPLPGPEVVPLDEPLPIARWMAQALRTGRTPHLWTFTSPAVRLCQAARDAGLDLRGSEFTLGGEPITAARLATIRAAGAEARPIYASMEAGGIGYACLAPETPDDVHLLHDRVALIRAEHDRNRGGLPPGALLISSLRPSAPLILLNASLGDQADVVRRGCGCPMEQLGWGTHLHTIRGYDKLTAGGMTFLDSDLIRVLEEALPARFGGGPTDYQLVEEEDTAGRPRLRLLVHPALGPLDGDAVADALLSAIGDSTGAEQVMALQWRSSGLLEVERRAPRVTATGKILHLHQERRLPAGKAD